MALLLRHSGHPGSLGQGQNLNPDTLLGVTGAIIPYWNAEDCTNCDLCLSVCPVGAIRKTPDGYRFDESRCICCSACSTKCPTGAWKAESTGSIVWVGGTMGRVPRLATRLTGVVEDREALFVILGKAVDYYLAVGLPGERFARTLDRLGVDHARNQILGR